MEDHLFPEKEKAVEQLCQAGDNTEKQLFPEGKTEKQLLPESRETEEQRILREMDEYDAK